MRRCVACRKSGPQERLIRLYRREDGELAVTTDRKRIGRGAYCCPDLKCINVSIRKKLYQRSLRVSEKLTPVDDLLRMMAEQAVVLNKMNGDETNG